MWDQVLPDEQLVRVKIIVIIVVIVSIRPEEPKAGPKRRQREVGRGPTGPKNSSVSYSLIYHSGDGVRRVP